jgi:hypothetical protein
MSFEGYPSQNVIPPLQNGTHSTYPHPHPALNLPKVGETRCCEPSFISLLPLRSSFDRSAFFSLNPFAVLIIDHFVYFLV